MRNSEFGMRNEKQPVAMPPLPAGGAVSSIPHSALHTPHLVDTFGRTHNNLRISVTDRCNLRCTYCMPEDVTFLDRAELLSFEEITRFVRAGQRLGINKVRL